MYVVLKGKTGNKNVQLVLHISAEYVEKQCCAFYYLH